MIAGIDGRSFARSESLSQRPNVQQLGAGRPFLYEVRRWGATLTMGERDPGARRPGAVHEAGPGRRLAPGPALETSRDVRRQRWVRPAAHGRRG